MLCDRERSHNDRSSTTSAKTLATANRVSVLLKRHRDRRGEDIQTDTNTETNMWLPQIGFRIHSPHMRAVGLGRTMPARLLVMPRCRRLHAIVYQAWQAVGGGTASGRPKHTHPRIPFWQRLGGWCAQHQRRSSYHRSGQFVPQRLKAIWLELASQCVCMCVLVCEFWELSEHYARDCFRWRCRRRRDVGVVGVAVVVVSVMVLGTSVNAWSIHCIHNKWPHMRHHCMCTSVRQIELAPGWLWD